MASDAVAVIDTEDATGSGGTVSGSYEVPNLSLQHRVEHAVVVEADVNGDDLDVDVRLQYNGTDGDAEVNGDNSYTGLDATTYDQVVYPETSGASSLEITVTNGNASTTAVSVFVVPYRA